MHLIQGKLSGREIPSSIPPSLIPPSMRGVQQQVAPPQAPPAVQEPVRDLLWDDSPPPSATLPQQTGSSPVPTPAQQSTPFIPRQTTGQAVKSSSSAFSLGAVATAFGGSPFVVAPPTGKRLTYFTSPGNLILP